MLSHDHLVGYGVSGDFGRFRAAAPIEVRRGRRIVVRTPRGLELGQSLRPADERLARWLPNTTVGELLRAATVEDERLARAHACRAGEAMTRGTELIGTLALPLALLDVEILLDGQNAVLHLVRWQECDVRDLVRPLSSEFDLVITLADLAAPVVIPEHADDHGCGSCGSGGGCGDCSSGGGCGSCGSETSESDKAHFAELRQRMERRVTLL